MWCGDVWRLFACATLSGFGSRRWATTLAHKLLCVGVIVLLECFDETRVQREGGAGTGNGLFSERFLECAQSLHILYPLHQGYA
jgi:hypothetical protein